MRAREWEIMSRAVEEGVRVGWRRAHKHTTSPGEEQIVLDIENAVLGAICEMFMFDNKGDSE